MLGGTGTEVGRCMAAAEAGRLGGSTNGSVYGAPASTHTASTHPCPLPAANLAVHAPPRPPNPASYPTWQCVRSCSERSSWGLNFSLTKRAHRRRAARSLAT